MKDDTFEKRLERLEEISRLMEDHSCGLEKTVSLFEEGMKLAKQLDEEVSRIERKVEIVTSSEDGDSVVTQPYN